MLGPASTKSSSSTRGLISPDSSSALALFTKVNRGHRFLDLGKIRPLAVNVRPSPLRPEPNLSARPSIRRQLRLAFTSDVILNEASRRDAQSKDSSALLFVDDAALRMRHEPVCVVVVRRDRLERRRVVRLVEEIVKSLRARVGEPEVA